MNLGSADRLVLWGLCSYPEASDGELAKSLNLQRSTVTVLRNRLYEGGYSKIVGVPDLGRLGAELIGITYADLNPLADAIRWREKASRGGIHDGIFCHLGFSNFDLWMNMEPNVSELYRGLGRIMKAANAGQSMFSEHPNNVIFPLDISRRFLFFDFSDILADRFGFSSKKRQIIFGYDRLEACKLKKREKLVLLEMTKNPRMTDREISDAIGSSRQTVNKVKNSLLERGLYRAKVIPDLGKIGLGVMAFTHTRYNPQKPIEKRKTGIREILWDRNQFFIISTDTESIRLSAFKDYRDFQSKYNEHIRHYRERDFIKHNPLIRAHPISNQCPPISPDFYGPLKKILNGNG